MSLLLHEPQIARRPCHVCERYDFDEKTGEIIKGDDGEPLERPAPDKNFPFGYAPCRIHQAGKVDQGCPKGTPEESAALTPTNELALEHYQQCRAINKFPDDPIVRLCAQVIREQYDNFERSQAALAALMQQAAALTK